MPSRILTLTTLLLLSLTQGCAAVQTKQLDLTHLPGTPTQPSLEQDYIPGDGQRYIVNNRHTLPEGMVVQGDTVRLSVPAAAIVDFDRDHLHVQWKLEEATGSPTLTPHADSPLSASFLADGYGVSRVVAVVTDGEREAQFEARINCEFSTGVLTGKSDGIALPDGWEDNPLVGQTDQDLFGHREQITARNPETGRLVTMWQVKFGASDAAPMGIAVMTSDDHGLTWNDREYLYLQDRQNAGWGSLCWNPAGNDGKGEFLIWACSHVRSDDNRMMLFRSRNNAQTWEYIGNFADQIREGMGHDNTKMIYFGVNRTILTSHGTLISPMVCTEHTRAIWSDDNGATWHNSNLDNSFPQGNEDAVIETIDGGKVIMIARPRSGVPKRFESTDGGRTWINIEPGLTVPMTTVNFGLSRIDEPGHPRHGQIMHCAAATREGAHSGRQMLAVSLNGDTQDVAEDSWDTRLLLDYPANYSDILYLPEDGSIYVTVETTHWGRPFTGWGDTPIRYFKFSTRYWEHLPTFAH